MTDPDHMAAFALRIAAQAEPIARSRFRSGLRVDRKDDASPVTEADQETERFLRDAILAEYPDHGIFGEEHGVKASSGRYQWVIDPIDGTKSFITGVPLYGMLLALLRDEVPVFGLIRMPELGETYLGMGGRTVLNGETTLRCAPTRELRRASLTINEGQTIRAEEPSTFARLCASGQLNRFGYDCYPYALVAAGHVDACVDYGLKPYDYFALVPVIEGAGGVMTDWSGKTLDFQSDGRVVAAATPELHAELLEVLGA